MTPAPLAVSVLRCEECGALDPGPRELCPVCFSARMAPADVPGVGRLVSRTVIRRPPARFRDESTYVVAVVDLDAGPRVTGRLVNADHDLVLGARVVTIGQGEGYASFRKAET